MLQTSDTASVVPACCVCSCPRERPPGREHVCVQLGSCVRRPQALPGAWLRLLRDGDFLDHTGGSPATCGGSTCPSVSVTGGAAFDGADDELLLRGAPDLGVSGSSFSIALWLRLDAAVEAQVQCRPWTSCRQRTLARCCLPAARASTTVHAHALCARLPAASPAAPVRWRS